MTESQIHVLVIDDEQQAYQLVRDMLSLTSDEFVIDWALNFDEGIESLKANQHDVYLVDYILTEGRFGLELLAEARQVNQRAPIIILTGHGTPEVDLKAMQLGAQDYIEKTQLNPVMLERSIRYAIERKRAETELQRLYMQVQELEQLKTDMIRIASHDLGSPVTAILGMTDLLLLDENKDEEDQDYLRRIQASARKIQKIISDILSLERIQDLHKSGMQFVDLRELVLEAVEEQRPFTDQKSQDLQLEIADGSLFAEADPAQVKEAIANLIGNAHKYTPSGGQIIVRLHQEKGVNVFEVEDNGPGIADEQQSRLFQPFYRAGDSESQKIEGSGLGLHLVKSIILRHNGQMYFESVYGEGSTFGFTLPIPASNTIQDES